MYNVNSALGKGTYGKVYSASSLLSRRGVAIKRLLIDPKTKGSYALSLREMDMMARFSHPHVVPLLEVLFELPPLSPLSPLIDMNGASIDMRDDTIALVMPEASTTLFKFNTTELPFSERKSLMWQLIAGVQHIHQRDVLHRDLKPQNLLIFRTNKLTLKVADFGLATPDVRAEARTPQMVTLWYRAPEILLGKDYDSKVDCWSIGCILFEIVSKRALFHSEDEGAMLKRIFELLGGAVATSEDKPTAQRKKRAFVKMSLPSGNNIEALHQELALNRHEISSFNSEGGSYFQLLVVLAALLAINPAERASLEQVLKLEYFDAYRVELALIASPPPKSHQLLFHPRRTEGIAIIDGQDYPIQYRVKFLALDILDRVLLLDTDPSESLLRKYAFCALYIAEKYLMCDRCCSFSELRSANREDFADYERTEKYILQVVLQYKIYRKTLYDYMDVMEAVEVNRAYSLFRNCTILSGIILEDLFRIYKYTIENYYVVEKKDKIVIV